MIKGSSTWSEEERQKVARAMKEHRLNRVDLYLLREVDEQGRKVFDIAIEFMSTVNEIERRIEQARQRLSSTLSRPSQEAYLGRWLST